jgi:phage terminase small subunit
MMTDKNQKPPDHLSAESKNLWLTYVGTKISSPGAIALFEQGLEALDRCKEASRQLREQGLLTVSERSGVKHASPLISIEKESRSQVIKIFKMLNLNILRL